MKKFLIACCLVCCSVASANNNYWKETASNTGVHFYYHYHSAPDMIKNWIIRDEDKLLVGKLLHYSRDMVLMIKPAEKYMLINHLSMDNKWWKLKWGTDNFDGLWSTKHDDLYVLGDFDGDGTDELLAANPSGDYRTMELIGSYVNFSWSSLQYATNGDIDHGDRLIGGDFDGDGVDETMLIKANGSHYTMKFNTQTSNWDIITGENTGSIYWWRISEKDQFIVGDYDGDGIDELLALNPSGWHHTMKFIAGQWRYIEGHGHGNIGSWPIGAEDKYAVGDFDFDGSAEIIAVNHTSGRSHTIEFRNQSWHWRLDNGNSGLVANWHLTPYDKLLTFNNHGLPDALANFSSSGWIKIQDFCETNC